MSYAWQTQAFGGAATDSGDGRTSAVDRPDDLDVSIALPRGVTGQ
jgi:hypothetical protein